MAFYLQAIFLLVKSFSLDNFYFVLDKNNFVQKGGKSNRLEGEEAEELELGELTYFRKDSCWTSKFK